MTPEASRYVIGIDLGTTNTVVSYVDTRSAKEEDAAVEVFRIPQLIAAGVIEPREQLPSFIYVAAEGEFAKGALDLPWSSPGQAFVVGELARDHGGKVPHRLVASAKSWLCHSGVDRTAAILPYEAPEEVEKISPIEAQRRILCHIRDAWNAQHEAPFERQEVLLTVPASFDAIARQLTVDAAEQAGLKNVTLLEEPQAAFYAWLDDQGDSWRDHLRVGERVLVCDIGGGTTDFTLIEVKDSEGDLVLERIAVGDHILLGGDNMDLALAVVISQKFGQSLDPWQTRALWYACRDAKERLFRNDSAEAEQVTILGRGSKVIGNSMTAELRREELEAVVQQGFFPVAGLADWPEAQATDGLHELGLPYAHDAAITKHLAKFLSAHSGRLPTTILFNGGVAKAQPLRDQVMRTMDGWARENSETQPEELSNMNPDVAVARGAAYYGLVRRGRGIRIRGGVARSYYVGIKTAAPAVPGFPTPVKALCVVPFGMEEGTGADVAAKTFGMVVGRPVEFRFFSSTLRKTDTIGTLVERWPTGELEELAPIHTEIADDSGTKGDEVAGTSIPVTLHTQVTEVGTLDLALRATDGRSWKLEYEVRDRQPNK